MLALLARASPDSMVLLTQPLLARAAHYCSPVHLSFLLWTFAQAAKYVASCMLQSGPANCSTSAAILHPCKLQHGIRLGVLSCFCCQQQAILPCIR